MSQQLGAALGLAVLVTVFESLTPASSGRCGGGRTGPLVHGLDVTFAVAAALSLAALSVVALFIRTPPQPDVAAEAELEMEPAAA